MVQKPVVRTWHREEFAAGRKESIPPQALAILEAEAAEKQASKASAKKAEPVKETKAE